MERTIYEVFIESSPKVYLGSTERPLNVRLGGHLREAMSKANSHKNHWIRSALKAGLAIEIASLDTAPTRLDGYWLEGLWQVVYYACRIPLVNACFATSGGSGGCSDPTPEIRRRISEARLAYDKQLPLEQRLAINSKKGRPHDVVWKSQHSSSMTAAWERGAYASRKYSLRRRPMPPRSAESKAKQGESMSAWWASRSDEERSARADLLIKSRGNDADRCRKQWAGLTPEARVERVAKIQAGRLRNKQKKKEEADASHLTGID